MSGNVVDFEGEKAARDAIADLGDDVRNHMREAVAAIAVLHGGKTDEWIEAKADACSDMMLAIARAAEPVKLSVPESLSPDDVEAVKDSVGSWARDHTMRCIHEFVKRILPLLGP